MKRVLIAASAVFLVLAGFIGLNGARAASAQQVPSGIASPQSLTVVQGNVVIEGTATHSELWKFEVHYAQEPNPTNWILIGDVRENQPVINGRLAVWNTNIVPDGTYSLRLRVARRDGNYDEFYVRQVTVSNTQPVETPTETPTTTPTPDEDTTPTPLPTLESEAEVNATPTILIEQPRRETPAPTEAPTAQPAGEPTRASVYEDYDDDENDETTVSTKALTSSFLKGGQLTLGVFLALGFLALVRTIFVSSYRWMRERSRRDDDFYD